MAQPIIDRFLKHHPSLKLAVLTLGQPATTLYEGYGCRVLPRDLGIRTHIIDGNAGRQQKLPPSDITALTAVISPRVVVEGMVYVMQSQLGSALRETASSRSTICHVIGLDDSFALWSAQSIANRFFVSPVCMGGHCSSDEFGQRCTCVLEACFMNTHTHLFSF